MRRLTDWQEAADLLAAGGLVLLPTDTIPGFHCRADDREAVGRLARLKQRPADKPFLLLCASVQDALSWTATPGPRRRAYAERCWPGPFTLVLPSGPNVPSWITGAARTVALRVPEWSVLRDLVTGVGAPLVSTSANLSGEKEIRSLTDVEKDLPTGLDGLFWPFPEERDREPGTVAPAAAASALIDLTAWPPRLLREGPAPVPPIP